MGCHVSTSTPAKVIMQDHQCVCDWGEMCLHVFWIHVYIHSLDEENVDIPTISDQSEEEKSREHAILTSHPVSACRAHEWFI